MSAPTNGRLGGLASSLRARSDPRQRAARLRQDHPGSLKAEIGTRVFASRAEARREVFAYINYYNNKRLHSTVNHQTPREARVCYRPPTALAA
ncbi:IS3 family transposase [Paractinoplanes aksuensis]|uniref:IS3 family transposase n=1 Tax=Paractinoplanes aksuensis TaxID=2939490 RepID=UPI0034DAD497